MPFSVNTNVDHPISLYAASKKSNELMAHSYSHLFRIPTTGLRFFTVYGPWGRPDMAPFIFTKAIMDAKPIEVFNQGNMFRDFTFIDDIVEGIVKVGECPAKPNENWNSKQPDPSTSTAPYKIYNIGNSNPIKLIDFIQSLEDAIGTKAKMTLLPLQAGDVKGTWADVSALSEDFNYHPNTTIEDGAKVFVNWFKGFYS